MTPLPAPPSTRATAASARTRCRCRVSSSSSSSIESTPGTGDHGEWLEVASTLACAIDLKGLRGECPTGAKVNTFAIDDDVWIPALGTFVVGDSTDPAIEPRHLPGSVDPLGRRTRRRPPERGGHGHAALREHAHRLGHLSDPEARGRELLGVPDRLRPEPSARLVHVANATASWFPAFTGTPNAPNNDVHCPTENDD